jgi:hypothetical protein
MKHRPPFDVQEILAWADAYHARTGAWPNENTGPVIDARGETWRKIDVCLRGGFRGLHGGDTLVRLLAD